MRNEKLKEAKEVAGYEPARAEPGECPACKQSKPLVKTFKSSLVCADCYSGLTESQKTPREKEEEYREEIRERRTRERVFQRMVLGV